MPSTFTHGLRRGPTSSCSRQELQRAWGDGARGLERERERFMSPEGQLIRALAEDLALEILAAYSAEDFADADFTTLGKAAVYLADHGSAPGPALEELIAKVQRAADTDSAT